MVRYQTVLKWWDRYQMQVGPVPKLIINFKFRKGTKMVSDVLCLLFLFLTMS